ncbi:hypothetical protein ACLOJK_001504 [Asimina triloba]
MAEELAQSQQVYAAPRSIQVWRSLLNWLVFFFQILLQIFKVTPSLVQLVYPSSSPAFKPLPLHLPQRHRQNPESPDDLVPSAADDEDYGGCDGPAAKLTIVLDLDETLVCAYETSSLPAIVRNQATEAGLKWFELECVSADKDYEGKQKVSHVTVFERPGLHDFLQKISEFADLVLFTAGLEGYARPLVDRIDLDNRFSLRLYRPSTISTLQPILLGLLKGRKYREHVKDLSCLSKDLGRTVLVDNNPFSFLLQPLNGIPCVPFAAGQPHDDQLIEVLLPLLKHLSLQKDVRPVLYERFHMPEWFERHGIPNSFWTL